MSHTTIRIAAVVGIFCITGIIVVQIGWFVRAQRILQDQEELKINLALKEVAAQIYDYNQLILPDQYMVKQTASNYYVVMTNSPILPSLLEYWLTIAFEKNNLNLTFNYGIYDCLSEKLVFSNQVSSVQEEYSKLSKEIELPEWAEDNHYFSVLISGKQLDLFGDMRLWSVSSFLVLLISIYFVYLIWMLFRQKHLSELQKDFVNNMAHEFNTPISSIRGAAQLMVKKNELDSRYLNIIIQESENLQLQVERSLEISNLNESQNLLDKTALELGKVIISCIEKARIRLPDSFQINFIDNFQNCKVRADLYHLECVIQNLIENAYKYRKTETGILTITLFSSETWAKLSFVDNGVGIKTEDLNNIFRKFYRVKGGNLHQHKGFGLGLYYVKQTMDFHGGKVTVESVLDQGSNFTIALPIIK